MLWNWECREDVALLGTESGMSGGTALKIDMLLAWNRAKSEGVMFVKMRSKVVREVNTARLSRELVGGRGDVGGDRVWAEIVGDNTSCDG